MWRYLILVFLSGAFTMTLELVASRLVAPVLGVSLYTWTSVIGVVLLGMSVGNFTGGWMADRSNPEQILGPVLMVSGAVTALVVPALPVLHYTIPWLRIPIIMVIVPILTLFGLPSLLIGLVSPIAYRICLMHTERTGSTVGRLAAAGSLGSIVGTFATGFFLIPAFGTRRIVIGVATGLVMLGLLAQSWHRRRYAPLAFLLVLAVASASVAAVKHFSDPAIIESAYFQIKVKTEESPDGSRRLKKLVLDSLVHSAADPGRPDDLWYEYERVAAWVITNLKKPSMRTFFIGGGGYTLPHWVERHYPAARVEVAEIDPAVTAVALEHFVPDSKRIVTYNEDGRTALQRLPESEKYDLIFGDAFNDVSVPYHLTTLEFGQAIKEHLAEGGVYMANIVDSSDGDFLGAFANTLSKVFRYVYVLPGSDIAAYGARSPHIVVAAMHEVPISQWDPPLDLYFDITIGLPDPKRLLLTDDYAPVDNLLLPVFAARITQ